MNDIPATKHQATARAALDGFLKLVSPIVFYKFASCLSSLCKSEVNGWGWRKVFGENILCHAGLENSMLHCHGNGTFIMTP